MNISFLELTKEDEKYFKNELKNLNFYFSENTINEIDLNEIKDSEAVCIFIKSKINSKIIKQLPKLKFIITRSAGTDHIDEDYCKKNNIQIFNLPNYGSNTVAEHAFALILSLTRRINTFYYNSLNKNFNKIEDCFEIFGKTMGVIGTGRIGLSLIKIAKGFDMKIKAYDTNQNLEASKKMDFEYVTLKDLLSSSDIISIHIPLTDKTKEAINEESFKVLKKGAIIINTSRKSIIKESCLIDSIKSGKVSAVGLDVFDGEDDPANSRLFKELSDFIQAGRVILTPHAAFYSLESIRRINESTVKIIKSLKNI